MSKEIQEIHFDMGLKKGENRVACAPSHDASGGESRGTTATSSVGETPSFGGGGVRAASAGPPEVSHVGWGRWYTLREVEMATNGFGEENVIGEGGYGIVYKGVLGDGTPVAVKNLLNNR